MSLPKTILVPTDFGPAAEDALTYATSLAIAVSARVILLNVVRIPALGMVEMGAVVTAGVMDSTLVASQLELNKLTSRHGGTKIETMVRTGESHHVILEVAAEVTADLIVMGTHGRHGIRRLVLGSVAEAIVRSATCPVLTVHAIATAAA
jgi:nucleotide-binding universal stress UspA family protein